MPIHHLPNGKWKWGKHGKEYDTKAEAEKQMRAIFANGYKGENLHSILTTEYLNAPLGEHAKLDQLINTQIKAMSDKPDPHMQGLTNGLLANHVVDNKEGNVNFVTLGEEPINADNIYVWRDVLNSEDIIKWAKKQEFDKVVPANELHVTIAYSREPVENARLDTNGVMLLADGSTVEPLGDEGAVVLKFKSNELADRWQYFRDHGASWDYENYTPHITITYSMDSGFDISKVQPYTGFLELGPEKSESLNEEWKDNVIEESAEYYSAKNKSAFASAVNKVAKKLNIAPKAVAYHYTLDPKYFMSDFSADDFADKEFALGISDSQTYEDQRENLKKVYSLDDDEVDEVVGSELFWQNKV